MPDETTGLSDDAGTATRSPETPNGQVAGSRRELDEAREEAVWLRTILDSATDYAIITTDPAGRVTSWNAGARNLLGWDEAEALGLDSRLLFTPEDRASGAPEAERAKAAAEGRAEDERWHVCKDGGRFWGSGLMMPFRGAPAPGFLKIMRDRTGQRRVEAALRASEERLALALQAAELGIWEVDLAAGTARLDARCRAIAGREEAEIGREQALAIVHPEDRAGAEREFRTAARAPGDYVTEKRIVRRDGTVCWVHARGKVVLEGEGATRRPVRMVGVAMDVSERKEAEERQALLIRELAHRVKNTLAVILAMARQTGARAAAVADFLDLFEGRLRALAAAHELLTESGWRSTPLAELGRAALAAHAEPGDGRIRIRVEDLLLTPAAAQSLVLALHELATNATKHGALSAPDGTATLEGRVEGADLVLAWREAGGPPAAAPAEPGFGVTLLERIIAHQHGGRVDFDWRPEGLVCRLRLPLAEVADQAGALVPEPPARPLGRGG